MKPSNGAHIIHHFHHMVKQIRRLQGDVVQSENNDSTPAAYRVLHLVFSAHARTSDRMSSAGVKVSSQYECYWLCISEE